MSQTSGIFELSRCELREGCIALAAGMAIIIKVKRLGEHYIELNFCYSTNGGGACYSVQKFKDYLGPFNIL